MAYIRTSFSFYGWIIFHYLYVPHFVYPFICWLTFGWFTPFGNCDEHWCTIVCLRLCFQVFSGTHLGVELLGHMVIIRSFWRTAKLVDILSFWTAGSAFSFGTGLCNLFRWSGLPGLLSDTKESDNEVVQLCQTLCNPVDCSPPVSSIHGIFQARILEWVAISFSRGSSPPRDRTWVSHTAGGLLTV